MNLSLRTLSKEIIFHLRRMDKLLKLQRTAKVTVYVNGKTNFPAPTVTSAPPGIIANDQCVPATKDANTQADR